ncbi:hypothetical protein E6O75_ATG11365 [Venturia nashicola]|uniref:Rhodopsin domain-containing protein n=1 Tax=Venturia nashicola TaxID=86259 RepID=A0A4Z1NXX9_9PEZI|nr:hypothetical protein E6O75_ATG11365 [Venturia nashicola]
MRDVPIDVFMQFPLPNYTNPKTRGSALVYTNGILIAITIVFVLLRVYTRVFIKGWIGVDDWLILVAAFFTVGLTTCVVLANEKNRHIWDIPFTKIAALGQIAIAAKLFFSIATFFTRMSLLSFYYRLLHDTALKTYRLVLHAACILNAMVFIAFIALTIFQCSPVEAYWTFPSIGKCLDEGKLMLSCAIISCFLDLLITILPIPMVMMLKMQLRQRIGVIFLLSLGFVVTIAGVVRTYYIYKSLILSYDETWFAYPLWIAAAVEVDLAVICACAPVIRPFLLMYIAPLSSSRGERSHSKSDGYTSTGSGPSGQSVLCGAKATFDERISGFDVVRDDGKTPTVKLSLTKSPHEGKLMITQRVSWEVDYDDQSKLRHPSIRGLPDNEYTIGRALSSASDEERHSRAKRNRPHSCDVTEVIRQSASTPPLKLQYPEPDSPTNWTEHEPLRSAGTYRPETATSNGKTFWRSDSDGDSYQDSTDFDYVLDADDGQRGWAIRHNPFWDEEHVNSKSPALRTYEGARVLEMRAFSPSYSRPLKVGQDTREH